MAMGDPIWSRLICASTTLMAASTVVLECFWAQATGCFNTQTATTQVVMPHRKLVWET